MAADRAFATATAERGIDGWMEYFTEDGTVYQADEVARGHVAIRRLMGPLFADTTVRLVWEPDDAVASPDGHLSYTTGPYRVVRVSDDSVVSQGTYLTVWRRTEQGWKVVADIGAADTGP
jgi:ketosteroid isomerase-like protein